jgi:hypothetical protein
MSELCLKFRTRCNIFETDEGAKVKERRKLIESGSANNCQNTARDNINEHKFDMSTCTMPECSTEWRIMTEASEYSDQSSLIPSCL